MRAGLCPCDIPRAEATVQDIVLVCRDHQIFNGKSHTFGDVTRKNIPEISRRHCKAYASLGRAERTAEEK